MSLDFQQIRQQIIDLGSKAPERQKEISKLRDTARKLLTQNSMNQDFLRPFQTLPVLIYAITSCTKAYIKFIRQI